MNDSGPSQDLKIRELVVMGGDNMSLLVEIGLTDLPKTGEVRTKIYFIGNRF